MKELNKKIYEDFISFFLPKLNSIEKGPIDCKNKHNWIKFIFMCLGIKLNLKYFLKCFSDSMTNLLMKNKCNFSIGNMWFWKKRRILIYILFKDTF